MRKKYSCIIVAYKPDKKKLQALLSSCSAYLVIVVDNGGTLDRDDVKPAVLLPQPFNIGFGAAANRGIHFASGHGSEWFVILNQDVSLTRVSAHALINLLKQSAPGVYGTVLGSLDERRWTTKLPADSGQRYVTGSCICIHAKVIAKVGYFHEPYFLYYEDADLCIRASKAGFVNAQLSIGTFSHEETMSLGKGSFAHQYYLARNHLLFVKRLAPPRVTLYEVLRGIVTIVEHVVRREYGALAGIRDFLLGRFGPLQKE